MALIMIDPGHGGHHSGAVGRRSREKDNVLNVAKRLKSLLEGYGHSVMLTRSSDIFISLTQRANMANRARADYFLSLHNNASVSRAATGFETFIYNGSVSSRTRSFQNAVHQAIASKINIQDRGKKRANFAVVRQTTMPAVLIEYGFITNTRDESILMNQVNQLAQWTCEGVLNAIGGSVPPYKPTPKPKPVSKPKVTVQPPVKASPKKKAKANLKVDGYWGKATTRALQRALGTPVDGVLSNQLRNSVTDDIYSGITWGSGGSLVVKALQRKVGAKVDGYLGPETIRRLQRYLGTPVDGILSKPSVVVKELQRRLNKGTF